MLALTLRTSSSVTAKISSRRPEWEGLRFGYRSSPESAFSADFSADYSVKQTIGSSSPHLSDRLFGHPDLVDLNDLSRRSSSDLMSLNFFLRSSSAFRLAGLRTGSHLVIDSRTPLASGGSVLLINIGCCLLISRARNRRHSRLVAGEACRTRRTIEEDIGFSSPGARPMVGPN